MTVRRFSKILIILLLLPVCASAAPRMRYNPHTRKPDWVQDVSDNAPANTSDACDAGDIAYASGYIYVCVSDDSWERASLSTWAVTDKLLLSSGDKVLLSDGTSHILVRK